MPESTNQHIAIIGTGFSGLGMAIRLKQAGFHDFTVFEQASHIGGTWHANHYPGAACDVQSHLYSFSFAPNPDWSRMFGQQAEIETYLNRCADQYGVRQHIRFNTGVTGLVFDEASGEWTVSTSRGESLKVRAVVSGSGGLSRPAYPDIQGLDQFAGPMFHSAEWQHDVPMAGKTVGVIGTGASAIQFVPQLQKSVGRLQLFQRTPPWILPKPDRRVTGLEKWLFRTFPITQKLARGLIYSMLETRVLGFTVHPWLMAGPQWLANRHIRKTIKDPALISKVTPLYTIGCKRVLISNDYYPALAQSNVNVIDDAIECVEQDGVRLKNGQKVKLDALILGTGFQAAEAVAPFPVKGIGGRDLNESWKDGAEAYYGTTVSGFPNLFFVMGPNTGLGHSSMVYMIESQIQYVMSALEQLKARKARYLDVLPQVQKAFNAQLQRKLDKTVWASGCVSWYRTRTGKNTTLWPSYTFAFRWQTRKVKPVDYRWAGTAETQKADVGYAQPAGEGAK